MAYPDYTQPFILETDASLKGPGSSAVSKRARTEKFASSHMQVDLFDHPKDPCATIVQPKSNLWHSSGQYAKKFKDYLLGSKFTVFTDNNPLVYVKTSKLGAAQIRWLSELALYDFDIVY